MNAQHYLVLFSLLLFSCTNHIVSIKNEQKGKLTANYQLLVSSEKRILLDDETAPKPPYMQMIKNEQGEQILTLLNPHKNAIYFYDYASGVLQRKIEYEKEGPDGILRLTGYYINNMDSIYIYNMSMTEVALTDSAGRVKQRISLRGDHRQDWPLYFPQYLLNTVIPLIKIRDKLILTGFSPLSVTSQMIDKFRFTACIDIKTSEVEFMYTYPEELYGFDSNWEGGMATLVYPEISPAGEIIHSFATSHNLYIAPWNSDAYQSVYAGSNTASTIHSIDWSDPKTTSHEIILTHHIQEDMYTAIRYDPYRKVYYRILLQGVPNVTHGTTKEKKPIAVIIMDEQFNYMGETIIGTGEEWNWSNSFVTSEGLVMEYIDPDVDAGEDYLILKTFIMEEI